MATFSRCGRRIFLSVSTSLVFSAMLVPLVALVGCEQAGKGVSRYDYSGQITYDGKPVPKGYLRFVPDKEKGNGGPGTSASIIDGRYRTLPGQGAVSGPHIIYIFGTDGIPIDMGEGIPPNPNGRPIFPEYEVRVDLPKEASTHDFDVPASHGQEEPAEQEQEESAEQD